MSSKKTLSPYKLGNLPLKNRIVMAPMTRSRAIGNIPNKLMAEYYQQRASAGLIVGWLREAAYGQIGKLRGAPQSGRSTGALDSKRTSDCSRLVMTTAQC